MPGGGIVPRMYEDDEEGGGDSEPEESPAMPGGGFVPREYDMDEEGEEMDSNLSSVKHDLSGAPYLPSLPHEYSSDIPEFSA